MVGLYLDVHVPSAVLEQLRLRTVDVFHAIDEGNRQLPDDQLLEIARLARRVMVTTDHRFRAYAEQLQREAKPFCGLIYCPSSLGVGIVVKRLEHISKATQQSDWIGQVMWLAP